MSRNATAAGKASTQFPELRGSTSAIKAKKNMAIMKTSLLYEIRYCDMPQDTWLQLKLCGRLHGKHSTTCARKAEDTAG